MKNLKKILISGVCACSALALVASNVNGADARMMDNLRTPIIKKASDSTIAAASLPMGASAVMNSSVPAYEIEAKAETLAKKVQEDNTDKTKTEDAKSENAEEVKVVKEEKSESTPKEEIKNILENETVEPNTTDNTKKEESSKEDEVTAEEKKKEIEEKETEAISGSITSRLSKTLMDTEAEKKAVAEEEAAAKKAAEEKAAAEKKAAEEAKKEEDRKKGIIRASRNPNFANLNVWQHPNSPYKTLWGQCTWFAWHRFFEIYGYEAGFNGNGYETAGQLVASHPDKFYLSSEPKAGAVFSYMNHTGLILEVKDGMVTIQDGNYDGYTNSIWEEAISDWQTRTIPISEMSGYGAVYACPNATVIFE